jgi:DNA (cytosine-5)-methyltransferase 1
MASAVRSRSRSSRGYHAGRSRPHAFQPVDPRSVNVYARPRVGLRFIDFFAGAGGLTIGADMAGMEPVLCANHNSRAIETHGTNYGQVEHLMGDLSVLDPTLLPRGFADVLVAAPECVFHSSARNYREAVRELAPWDPKRAAERSRATMWCSQRWADHHDFLFVFHENVVGVARWNQIGNWVDEWSKIGSRGYEITALCLNAAFFGAPQSRDRLYLVARRKDVPAPVLDFRPLAYCWSCRSDIYAVQTWKKAALARGRRHPLGPIGKYGITGGSYLYTCPDCPGAGPNGHAVVSPYATPAAEAIDPEVPTQIIRDRDRPLSPKTMARIERGFQKILEQRSAQLIALDHLNEVDSKRPRPMWLPYPTQTGREDIGLLTGPHVQVDLRGTNRPRPLSEPAATVAAGGNHLGFLTASHSHRDPKDHGAGGGQTSARARSGGSAEAARTDDRIIVQAAGHTFERPGYVRAWSVDEPHKAQTTDLLHGVASPPRRLYDRETFALANYGGHGGGHMRDASTDPLGTVTTGGDRGVPQHSLVETPAEPTTGGATGDFASPNTPREPRPDHTERIPADFEVDECGFRMVQPHECQVVQRLERRGDGKEYIITGSKDEQVKQIGNAVVPTKVAAIMLPLIDACCYELDRTSMAA